jgi:hypothetical protein
VLSRINGWMTVTPKRQSRKAPVEKEHTSKNGKINVQDQRRISGLSPVWMQDQSAFGKDKPEPIGKPIHFTKADSLRTVPKQILREENNRLVMVDTD